MENQPDYFLDIRKVSKQYATQKAVDQVSLQIPKGSVFGLLGPNGAGKTSLIRMITGITMPDEGSINFNGHPFKTSDQNKIGYMPEERGLYKKMKVRDQIIYLLQLKGMQEIAAQKAADIWLVKMEIDTWKNRMVQELSKGMQQKIQFIVTVAHQPELLILDEPFSGLDPLNAQKMEGFLHELKNEGTTIIFSTHRMEQVEMICNEIALIHKGKIVLKGNVKEIRKQFHGNRYKIAAEESLHFISENSDIKILSLHSDELLIELLPNLSAKEFIRWINDKVQLTKFELYLPSLNEIFIQTVQPENE